MKLIIGLGNPGEKYQNNRHNAGQMFIDWVRTSSWGAQRLQDPTDSGQARMTFLKTTVFMNQSGAEVKKFATYYKLPVTDLVIVHDDLDLQFGKFKIQKSGGPKLHNGIISVEKTLRTKDFWRVRIGVDNPSTRFTHSGQVRIDGETYVLQDFTIQEKEILRSIFKKVVDKLENVFHNEFIK